MAYNSSLTVKINGKLLERIINDKGYSLWQLSNMAAIDKCSKTIRIALNTSEIKLELLFRLCSVLHCSISRVLDMETYHSKRYSPVEKKMIFAMYRASLDFESGIA